MEDQVKERRGPDRQWAKQQIARLDAVFSKTTPLRRRKASVDLEAVANPNQMSSRTCHVFGLSELRHDKWSVLRADFILGRRLTLKFCVAFFTSNFVKSCFKVIHFSTPFFSMFEERMYWNTIKKFGVELTIDRSFFLIVLIVKDKFLEIAIFRPTPLSYSFLPYTLNLNQWKSTHSHKSTNFHKSTDFKSTDFKSKPNFKSESRFEFANQ